MLSLQKKLSDPPRAIDNDQTLSGCLRINWVVKMSIKFHDVYTPDGHMLENILINENLLNPPLLTWSVFEDRNLKSSYCHKCQGFCGSRHAPGGRGNNKKKVEVNKFQRQCLLSNFKFLTACQRSFFPIQDLQLSQETSVFEVFDLVLFVAHHSPSNWKKLTHNKVNSKHELWIIFTAFQFY